MDQPMKKTIVEIIRSSNFVWASSLWQLQLIFFVEQVKDYHHMLIFERVLSLRFLIFGYFRCQNIGIRRFNLIMTFVVGSPNGGGLKFFSRFLNYLSFLCVGLDDHHSNFHLVEEVMPACLEQHGQRHTCRTHEKKVVEPLYIVPDIFSSSLDRQEELPLVISVPSS